MNSIFERGYSMSGEIDSRYNNPFCELWGVKAPNDQRSNPELRQQLQEVTNDVESRIIQERNESLQKINGKLLDLKEVSKDLSVLIDTQGEQIKVIENHTVTAAAVTKVAVETLEVCQQEKSKQRRAGVFAGVGGSIGVAMGIVGFAINPIAGVAAMTLGGGFGFGVGGVIGMATK